MKYEDMLLADLRTYAMSIGVRGATKYNKKDLIIKILEVENGFDTPYFSKKGRPSKKRVSQINFEDIKDKNINRKRILVIVDMIKALLEEIELELKEYKKEQTD